MASNPPKARQIGKQALLTLVKQTDQAKSRMAEERGALGAKYEAAATKDNFNAKALRPLLPLLKMEAGPQAHLWRTILLYADHLGIGAQSDLEDYANGRGADGSEDEGDEEDEDNGEGEGDGAEGSEAEAAERVAEARSLADEQTSGAAPEGDPVDSILANMVSPALGRFRTSLESAVTIEAVNKGLERFTADNPDEADAALEIAQARVEAIGQEQGGGEDLRPASLKTAETAAAADAAQVGAAEGKTKRKRSTRKDAGKIGQVGDNLEGEFGGGSRAMH